MEAKTNGDRRRFLGTAATTIAGTQFGAMDAGTAPSSQTTASASTAVAPAPACVAPKQIDAPGAKSRLTIAATPETTIWS